jgi:hypothetical protein
VRKRVVAVVTIMWRSYYLMKLISSGWGGTWSKKDTAAFSGAPMVYGVMHLKPLFSQIQKIFTWYKLYILYDSFGRIPQVMKKFQKRFHLPWEQYLELFWSAWDENWFPSAEKKDCTGRMGHTLELMLLVTMVLRKRLYIQWSWRGYIYLWD